MDEMDFAEARESAIKKTKDLVQELATSVSFKKPGSETKSPSLVRWVKGWLARDDVKTSGVVLSPLMWLPAAMWACIAEYLFGERQYTDEPLGLMVRLRNVSGRTLRVVVGRDDLPTQVKNAVGWVDGDTWRSVFRTKKLEPGEEIELSAQWAYGALREHCRCGYDPFIWGESGAIPSGDPLLEVGYTSNATGLDGERLCSSPKPKAKSKAA